MRLWTEPKPPLTRYLQHAVAESGRSPFSLARECSGIFAPVRYQSMDIAILAQRPSIIEVNTGGAFNIPQLAGGRGFLTDEVLEFFRACGFKG